MIKFEYKGKIYTPSNLEKKLQKLGVTIDDVTILENIETNTDKIIKRELVGNNQSNIKYCYWDHKTKGWLFASHIYDFENEILPWYITKDRFEYIGEINENDEHYHEIMKDYWKKANKIEIRK